jgi:hypothetical protein
MSGTTELLIFPSPMRGGSPSEARFNSDLSELNIYQLPKSDKSDFGCGGESSRLTFCAVTPPGSVRFAHLATLPVKGREEGR